MGFLHDMSGMDVNERHQNKVTVGRAVPRCSSPALLRWYLLRRSLLASSAGSAIDGELAKVSRRPAGQYNLVPRQIIIPSENGVSLEDSVEAGCKGANDAVVEYSISPLTSIKLSVWQGFGGYKNLWDLAVCQRTSVDNTGIVCLWPAEEVLTYFCGKHPEIFRNKTVVELGSGYGLGGLAIAACTEATDVVITDGNPQVVDYIEQNIAANQCAFGNTRVSGATLFWSQEHIPLSGQAFDLVVAADCTFFTDFHLALAYTIKSLLGTSNHSEAILFNPRRGNTLDLFVHAVQSLGLFVEIKEHYDAQVWEIHQQLLKGDRTGWPNYDSNHCYPMFLSVTSVSRDLGF